MFPSKKAAARHSVPQQSRRGANRRRRLQLAFELLEDRRVLAVDVPPILDINAAPDSPNPSNFVSAGDTIFFTATTPTTGTELWKSDGSEAGTVLVKDIRVGSSSSGPTNLTNVNGTLYFSATDGVNGVELWKSDGTAAGTVMVKDIRTGGTSSGLLNLTDVNGTLYFRANDGVNGEELWKSDGTAAGTVMVKDIRPGSTGSFPFNLTNVNGTLFFSANDGASGTELWKSDGTAVGTVRVKDITAGSSSSQLYELTNVDGTLYFRSTDGVNGLELWKSDGTAAGTVLVKDIRAGSLGSSPRNLTNVNGLLYFSASDGVNGEELWKSDGTAAGTVLVKDINAGSLSSYLGNLTNFNGTLYFRAQDAASGGELWKSDGTAAGTVLVKDIFAGSSTSGPSNLTNVNGTLYFGASVAASGNELWKSDGTAAGTVMVKDIRTGSSSSGPVGLTNVNGTLYFRANDGVSGLELWKSNGTEAGTVLVKDILAGSSNSSPRYLTNVNGTLFFNASNGLNGEELWKSDGTAAGTVLAKDIRAGSSGSSPRYLTNVNGTLYFRATEGVNGYELWKSDGTVAGTVMVTNIRAGSSGSYPRDLTNVNGTLYFRATDGVNGEELWKSDGTAAGTVMVKDIRAGSSGSSPRYLTNVNGTLYFRVTDGVNGYELWKSDGTAAGTVLVKDIRAGSIGSYPRYLTNVNGTLYFRATDGVNGEELWKSDGTAAGTFRVKDILPGGLSSNISGLTNVGGTLYFRADNGVNGSELWKSDGTEAGTVMVKDINPGSASTGFGYFTDVDGTLFFGASNPAGGFELWKSDGTNAGTVMVKDIKPGSSPSYPRLLTNVNGTLYFSADDGVNGVEVWSSDGTEAGTVMVMNIAADGASSSPSGFTVVGQSLFFSATTATYGTELYSFAPGDSPPTGISLSPSNVDENSPADSVVGMFSTTDETASDSHTYTLVAGQGDADNAAFTIMGDELRTSAVFDFETKSSYSIRVRTTDSGGLFFEQSIEVLVNDVNEAPTALSLTNTSVDENVPVGTMIGTLQTTDPDTGNTFVYSLVAGVGATDNASFAISGDQLTINVRPDFETQSAYSIRVRTTDQAGLSYEQSFVINVVDILLEDLPPLLDINTLANAGSSSPSNVIDVGGIIFFTASTATTGTELWKSDGTAAGTVLVKDIHLGMSSSNPRYLTNVNGTLYFHATDGGNGYELWKSDGTAAGTVLVKDIRAGGASSYPRYLTNVNGTLYFNADDEVNGRELWKSDGTAAGTVLVKDIHVGIFHSSPTNLTNVNGTLYFRAIDGVHGFELWKSDGTAAGTVLVKDIRAGSSNSVPINLTNVNGTLYFNANDGVHGQELWKSDGTAAGTVLVKDIRQGTSGSGPTHLANLNGTLYFSANDGINGTELWKSDGTAAGTVLVKDIRVGSSNSTPTNLTNVNGTLYFRATDGVNGYELWKSDGTAAGTILVKDIFVGSSSSDLNNLTNVNGTLYFRATTGVNGGELWKSDGTAAGTVLVKDIRTGTVGSNPSSLTNVNGTLVFVANDWVTGFELWKSDGTAAGTVLVKDIRAGSYGSNPFNSTNVNGTIFFVANDGVHGEELWKSDGTAAGTVLVKDIAPGDFGSFTRYLTNVNGTLYFSANDGVNGAELWKSDGTAAGTVMVKNIGAGSAGSNPSYLTSVNGMLYFRADDGINGYELWKSDGTSAGTVLVKDIRAGGASSYPRYLTNVNGTMYFRADDGVNGYELWKSDGTAAGTVLVKDIRGGFSSSGPGKLTNVNGTLYFRADDGVNGFELWKSDGTLSGTVLVKDISPGSSNSYPQYLTNVNGTLYFQANDGVSGYELWKSDGTVAGTVLVKDVSAGTSDSFLRYLTNVNGTLYFRANDGVNGYELWKSDGTAGGTVIVKDVRTGITGSTPSNLKNVNGTLYFSANDGVHGEELWKSDGTAAGTVMVVDVSATGGSSPGELVNAGERLFFSATTDTYGRELYSLEVESPPTDISLSPSSIDENRPVGTIVGTLLSVDSSPNETFTYSFASGAGDTDNASFTIDGDKLRSAAVFDFETKSSYTIRVRTTDSTNFTFTRSLTITVNDVTEGITDITLGGNPVPENSAAPVVVGQLSTVADGPTGAITYTLVSGVGDTDNASFTIVGNEVRAIAPFDFETKSVAVFRVRATTAGGQFIERPQSVSIADVNESPTALTLSSSSFDDRTAIGTTVANLFSVDVDQADNHTYTLVAGDGDSDNAAFTIFGNQLRTAAAVDITQKSSYTIRLQTMDQGGLTAVQPFTLTVRNIGQPPTDITLTPSTLAENAGEILVGTLAAIDADSTDTHQFALVAGTGGNDNGSFRIQGNQVFATRSFDFEAATTAQLRVRATDNAGLTFEKPITVTITNVNEPARGIDQQVTIEGTTPKQITLTAIDPEGASLTYQVTQQPQFGTLSGIAPNLIYTPTTVGVVDTFFFRASDGTNPGLEGRVTITGTPIIVSLDPASDLTVTEAQGTFVVRIRSAQPALVDTVISLAYSGTATRSVDYSAPLTALLPAGQSAVDVTVTVTDDTNYESSETIIVQITDTSNLYDLGNPVTRTITVTDNDGLPQVSFRGRSAMVNENDPEAARQVTVGVQLDRVSTTDVTIPLTLSGTATNGSDFTLSATQVVIPAGQLTADVVVTVLDDTIPEPLAETIRLAFGTLTGAAVTTDPTASTAFVVTISPNDLPELSLTTSRSVIAENGGSVSIILRTFTPSATPITVPFTLRGTATLGEDYLFDTTPFVIPAGQTTVSRPLVILDDTLIEELIERVSIDIQNSATNEYLIRSGTTTVSIQDNESLVVTLVQSSQVVWENQATVNVTASLSRPSDTEVRVPVSLTIDGAGYATPNIDFSISGTEFVFAAGSTTASLTINVVNDTVNEAAERVVLALTPAVASNVQLGAIRNFELTIRDDDPFVSIGSSFSVQEETSSVSIPLTLSAPSNQPITVGLRYSGSATASLDYELPMTEFTFAPGTTSGTLVIPIIDDEETEPSEQITIELRNPVNGLLNPLAVQSAIRIIDNDGLPEVNLNGGGFEITERDRGGGFQSRTTASIEINLSSVPEREVRLILGVAGAAQLFQDYDRPEVSEGASINQRSADEFELVISAGTESVVLSFSAIEDGDTEGDETLEFELRSAENARLGQLRSVSGLIIDGNGRAGGYGYGSQGLISGASVFVDSNFNGVADRFVNPRNPAKSLPEYATTTELDGSFPLDLPDGVDLDGNGVFDAADGRLVLTGGIDTSTGLVWRTLMTAPLGFTSITPLTTLVEHLIRQQGMSTEDALARVNDVFDIDGFDVSVGRPLSGSASDDFAASQVYAQQVRVSSVVIQLASYLRGLSGDELTMEDLGEAVYAEIAQRIAVVGGEIDFASVPAIESLLNSVAGRVGLSSLAGNTDAVARVIAAGTTNIDELNITDFDTGLDYAAEVTKTKRVFQGIAADTLYELGKSQTTATEVIDAFSGTALSDKIDGSFANNLLPPVVTVAQPDAVLEGNSGTTILEFIVTLDGIYDEPVTVNFQTFDDTASDGTDYVAVAGTLTWNVGDAAEKIVQVLINGDTDFEKDEQFRFVLSQPVNAVVGIDRAQAIGRITNDETQGFSANSPASTVNTVTIRRNPTKTTIYQEDSSLFSGPLDNDAILDFSGVDNKSDDYRVDFSDNQYRSDAITFRGGDGVKEDEDDSVRVTGGVFAEAFYTASSATNSTLALSPDEPPPPPGEMPRRPVIVNEGVERVVLTSNVERLFVRVPGGAAGATLEDADGTSRRRNSSAETFPNAMVLSSDQGHFAPLVFNNPGVQLVILFDNPNATLTINSTDPAFTGTIDWGSSGFFLSNATIDEGQPIGTVVGRVTTLEPEYADGFTAELINNAGDNNLFALVDGELRTAANFDLAATTSYQVTMRITPATGDPLDKTFTVTVNDVSLMDFGDAPAPFPTLASNGGASHVIDGPRLGDSIDDELDGQPSSMADGDGDDDDGVMFGTIKVGEAFAGVNIDLQNAAVARVDAWIDFNMDGVWQPSEKVLDSVTVVAGLQTLNIAVPGSAQAGVTFARVRVSSAGGLLPTGPAADGEVEDYRVIISEDVTVNLPTGTADGFTVRRVGSNIELRDNGSQSAIGTIALETTRSLTLNSGSGDDRVIVDFADGGWFDLPDGLTLIDAGGTDHLIIRGLPTVHATYLSRDESLGNATVEMQLGSTNAIEFTGFEPLDVTGVLSFSIEGILRVGSQTLTIDSQSPVSLGELTTIAGGTIVSTRGFLLSVDDDVIGNGQLQSPNDSARPAVINGSVIGDSASSPIMLTGYVKGVGSLDHVSISGTHSPGLSPAQVSGGSVVYTNSSELVLELGGTTPGGSGHDQLLYSGTATLSGHLTVELINGFAPSVGDTFLLMKADGGIFGDFDSISLPSAPLGSDWHLAKTSNEVRLTLVDLAQVNQVILGNGTQRSAITSLQVRFEGLVEIDSNAFSLLKRGTGGGLVTHTFTTTTDSSGNTVATLLFDAASSFTRGLKNALVDGNYQLQINADRVRRLGTNLKLDGNNDGLAGGSYTIGTREIDKFFAMFGDTNGNRFVDPVDSLRLRRSLNRSQGDPEFDASLDFNGNGAIDPVDSLLFRRSLNRSLPFE